MRIPRVRALLGEVVVFTDVESAERETKAKALTTEIMLRANTVRVIFMVVFVLMFGGIVAVHVSIVETAD